MKHCILNADKKCVFTEAEADVMEFLDDHDGALELARILAKIKGETMIIQIMLPDDHNGYFEGGITYVHPPNKDRR